MKKMSTYIMNIDGSDIFKKTGDYYFDMTKELKLKDGDKVVNMNFRELYTATLPYNLDLVHLSMIKPEEIMIEKINGIEKQFTDAIINVTFKNCYKEGKYEKKNKKGEIVTNYNYICKTKDIRRSLYKKGFCIDGIKYVPYKRSTSKSREGKNLFIKESLFSDMMRWSHLGINFEEDEEIDLASLKAYESLTCSGLEDLVTIQPHQILLIDTIKGKFTTQASVTRLNGKEVKTADETIELENDIFDGQCLLDETIFNKANRKDNGMMLLRNTFFKGCAFNTKIGKFLHNRKPRDIRSENFKIKDMFGNEILASDIKLIITPSCLKLFKFAYKFGSDEEMNKQEMYKHWLSNISSSFGICKSEHSSHFGDMNQLAYQHINTLELSRAEVKNLAGLEIKYVNDLKNDIEVFKQHISLNDESSARKMMLDFINKNPDIEKTEFFNEFRKDVIESYVNRLKRGKIKIKDTDYTVLVSNPWEMLLSVIGKFDGSTLHKGKEVYCSRYEDGAVLTAFRNPHIASGNVLSCKNVYHDEFVKYFNFTDNICVINSYDNDIMDRLQGADFDSDTILLSSNPILVKKGKKCKKYLTPINKIKIDATKRKYNNEEMAEIDIAIVDNKVGEIVNLSQQYNSYYFHELNSGKAEPEKLKEMYDIISKLSSLSQVEIDKPKKYYENEVLNMKNELTLLRQSGLVPKNDNWKTIKPMFFKLIDDNKKKCF
ncbi:MAG: hypothetical protein AB7E42_02260 [Anaerotignaceae bacterium]